MLRRKTKKNCIFQYNFKIKAIEETFYLFIYLFTHLFIYLFIFWGGGVYGHITLRYWVKMHLSDLGFGYSPDL